MEDIIDYSKKLNEEQKKQKKLLIVVSLVVAFLSFSIGFFNMFHKIVSYFIAFVCF